MNQAEIIAMAREAGFRTGHINLTTGEPIPFIAPASGTSCMWEVLRFAALVAAKEREACADLCDKFAARTTEAQQGPSDSLFNVMWRMGLLSHGECARAIRARGQKEGV